MTMTPAQLLTHTSRRDRCPSCGDKSISAPIAPHVELRFPLLPVCVDTPREHDLFAPFTICLCEACGLIILRDTVDPQVLYQIFHSDGIGPTWDAQYESFAELIAKHHGAGRILEIGAGQGKLIRKLQSRGMRDIEVIDPVYEGPKDGVTVHDALLNPEVADDLAGQFAAVISSHTLEHFLEYNEYFRNAWTCLNSGGLLFTAVPNMEYGFSQGYGNMLNFEHPGICLNAHWLQLHYSNEFVVRELKFFRDHSVQIVAQKVATPVPFRIDACGYARRVLDLYATSIARRIATIREKATPDKENWLFGASNFSQPLFMYGLEESHFVGIMDNSVHKHDKRLYGTGLVCRKPERIVGKRRNLRVFLNLGHYNKEISEQLTALDPHVELVPL